MESLLKRHEHYEKINGEWCLVLDVGCDDFDRAAANRQRLADNKERNAADYWRDLDASLASIPFGSRLPPWVPQGDPYPLRLPPQNQSKLPTIGDLEP